LATHVFGDYLFNPTDEHLQLRKMFIYPRRNYKSDWNCVPSSQKLELSDEVAWLVITATRFLIPFPQPLYLPLPDFCSRRLSYGSKIRVLFGWQQGRSHIRVEGSLHLESGYFLFEFINVERITSSPQ
jgi:hypothetical protein